MDSYAAAKALLFAGLPTDGVAVVNVDDPRGRLMIDATGARVITCSLRQADATCNARIISATIAGMELELHGPWGRLPVKLPLIGRHNAMNALQAAAVSNDLGLSASQLRAGLESSAAPPGRLEAVHGPDDEVFVFVDYAHTDDALQNVLSAVKPFVPAGAALRVVFGCGGDRDRTKRPRMAAVAARFGDDLTITSDNPRTEDPLAIIEEVRAGLPESPVCEIQMEVDRERAIHMAVKRSQAGDVIVVAGKGHEDYQIIGTTKRPFDDRLVAREALRARAARLDKAGVR
jgi:UDP-N-acetylmuramoyl-L-alanyl-D-glutamate--2,6-diaminopimelate ligase